MGRVLVFADGLEEVAQFGMLDQPGCQDDDQDENEPGVIEGYLGGEIGDHRPVDGKGRYLGGQDAFGTVGDVLQIQGRHPENFSHGNRGQHEVGPPQAETDRADDQGNHQGGQHPGPDAVPGGNLLELHQYQGGVGTHTEVGRVPHRVLAGIAPQDIPARSHHDVDEDQDHDVECVRALHVVRQHEQQGDYNQGSDDYQA